MGTGFGNSSAGVLFQYQDRGGACLLSVCFTAGVVVIIDQGGFCFSLCIVEAMTRDSIKYSVSCISVF